MDGYVLLKKGKLIDVDNYIHEQIEDCTRFVCEMLGYSPVDVWQMDTYEFFRDFNRAKRKQAAHMDQVAKWSKK